MLDINTQLYVHFDNDSVFEDYSREAQDFSRDPFTIEMVAADDKLYIGYRKPINAIYLQITTANVNANALTLKYYNGSAFAAATKLDETNGLTRSGFISWNRNLTDEAATTINSIEAFWYEITVSADHSSTIIRGINTVFADDNDLKTVVPSINSSKFYVASETSHILAHVAARDDIIQYLRRSGNYKVEQDTGGLKDINIFDILQINQMREAAKWKALSVIFGDRSDEPEDSFDIKSRQYEGRYKAARDVMYLNLDDNDDGEEGIDEQLGANDVIVVRR